jgi:hypothetical protein
MLMGNSKLAAGCHLHAASQGTTPTVAANGILAQVQGNYVAAALRTLGQATRETPSRHEVLVEADHIGTVRLFIEKKQARHGRHSHYYWSAYRAEQVND